MCTRNCLSRGKVNIDGCEERKGRERKGRRGRREEGGRRVRGDEREEWEGKGGNGV